MVANKLMRGVTVLQPITAVKRMWSRRCVGGQILLTKSQ